jgi:hypothetical protein
MPDAAVRAGGRAVTLHAVLRGGRHVLVVPPGQAAGILGDPGLARYRQEFDVVTGGARGWVVLVRPDGHVAARGRPGGLAALAAYLRGLFEAPDTGDGLPRDAGGPVTAQATEGAYRQGIVPAAD